MNASTGPSIFNDRFLRSQTLPAFAALIDTFELGDDRALGLLAPIIRGADTGRPELAPQAAGLLAISLGLSRLFEKDPEMLGYGMTVYDSLYLWARDGTAETHNWNPGIAAIRPGA